MSKKKEKKKETQTVFDSKFEILSAAFDALEEKQEAIWSHVVYYKGDLELLKLEDQRIDEFRQYFFDLLENDLSK